LSIYLLFEYIRLTSHKGWGIAPPEGNPKGDAIKNAKTPVMDRFEKEEPFCELEAHGLAVGLPEGLMGNSEGKLQNHP
jgi:2,3-bisphosphoglycerate-independent phosphoglycerate mutase